ncbi:hypothetical protein GCM10022218_12450 [Sphingobacterium ginsenosidimutans]|uniref:Uncharacterized protein n=1 Tax=Sphingobacterium ginsenosidimutans TaxID=687845 RepID=A0ABP7ZW63_9SPHI
MIGGVGNPYVVITSTVQVTVEVIFVAVDKSRFAICLFGWDFFFDLSEIIGNPKEMAKSEFVVCGYSTARA